MNSQTTFLLRITLKINTVSFSPLFFFFSFFSHSFNSDKLHFWHPLSTLSTKSVSFQAHTAPWSVTWQSITNPPPQHTPGPTIQHSQPHLISYLIYSYLNLLCLDIYYAKTSNHSALHSLLKIYIRNLHALPPKSKIFRILHIYPPPHTHVSERIMNFTFHLEFSFWTIMYNFCLCHWPTKQIVDIGQPTPSSHP